MPGRTTVYNVEHVLHFFPLFREAGIIQMVESPIEKPGAILMRVRVPDEAKEFSPRVSFQCRLSYGVRTAPV